MSISIKTEKVIGSYGKLYRKLKSFELLEKKHLPEKYISSKQNCYKEYIPSNQYCNRKIPFLILNGVNNYTGWNTECFYAVGDTILEERFQEYLIHIKKCGESLRKINQELSQLRSKWKGEETFTF